MNGLTVFRPLLQLLLVTAHIFRVQAAQSLQICAFAPLLEPLTIKTWCSRYPTEQLWEVRMTPDKGRGLFALVDIPRGTHLLVEEPLVTIVPPPLVPGIGFSLAAMESAVADAFEGLTPIQKEEYLSCHDVRFGDEGKDEAGDGGPHSGRLMRILRSNAYNTQGGRVALYPKVALINHDCRPNVLNTDAWNKPTGVYRRIIVAARDIVAGEELVTTYIPLLADTATRRSRLAQYGFTCMCESCSAESAQDDEERVYMRQVLDELEAAVDLPRDDKEQQRVYALYAAKLATYIDEQGFVDYAAKTSKLAADFASWAGDTQAATHWSTVHKAGLVLVGEARMD